MDIKLLVCGLLLVCGIYVIYLLCNLPRKVIQNNIIANIYVEPTDKHIIDILRGMPVPSNMDQYGNYCAYFRNKFLNALSVTFEEDLLVQENYNIPAWYYHCCLKYATNKGIIKHIFVEKE